MKLHKNALSTEIVFGFAAALDKKDSLSFDHPIPALRSKDVWVETMNICRGSYALANILIPDGCTDIKTLKKTLFGNNGNIGNKIIDTILGHITPDVLHDAVMNTAIVWKCVWERGAGK